MLDNGEMPPEDSKQPSSEQRKQLARMDRAVSARRGIGERGRSRAGRPAAAQQCRIHLYDPRSDGRRLESGPRVSDRRRCGRGVHQHGKRPGHVARPADKVFRRGPRDRAACGAVAGRVSVLSFHIAQRLDERRARADSGDLSRPHATEPGPPRSTCRGSSSIPTTAAGCRSNGISRPRSTWRRPWVSRRRPRTVPVCAGGVARRRAMSGADVQQAGVDRAIAAAAKKNGLNAKYLGILWATLNDREPSLLLDVVRANWRAAKPADVDLPCRGNQSMAEGTVAIHKRRTHRKSRRSQGVAGAGQSPHRGSRIASQTARADCRSEGGHALSRRQRRRRWERE